jgi:hypothetical protein
VLDAAGGKDEVTVIAAGAGAIAGKGDGELGLAAGG